MARFTFCDGCDDREDFADFAQPSKITGVCVTIGTNSGGTSQSMHLCPTCETKLREIANPKSWPRKAVAA